MNSTRAPAVGRRVAGCDLGKATLKLVVGTVEPNGSVRIDERATITHEGRPMDAFCELYESKDIASCRALGATGLHADELVAPVITGLPEDACLEAALATMTEHDGALNLVSIGARGYAVLARDARGRVQYLENDKCSSGTGETMVKIAGRFGLTIQQADELARNAEGSIPITARCSVFAKSEMTHFGNQGRAADALFRGYFSSVATYVAALLERVRLDAPTVVVGGGAHIRALVDALSTALDGEVVGVEHPRHLEATGALLLAAEQCRSDDVPTLARDPRVLIRPKAHRFRELPPARQWAHRVERQTAPPVAPGAERLPAVLGLDLGSTGSKAVLTSIESGEVVASVYDRTRGNPVEAARRLIESLLSQAAPDVRAIGLTGSGREAVATVVRAGYPELADRIVVINEIVAHATAAIRCDEHDGESLSVVEIGGQDAKFIQIVGGQIVESDMNKACSAGTGSFLEEQALFYGVDDIEEFTKRAQKAERPPELGQMCTVFVAEAAAEAHNEGFSVDDLFGGFQYSVIHNYKNRVMGQRTFGKRIFFQGKPATGEALAWTLAAVADRDVIVPPDPGAMGAWGIGLSAIEKIGADVLGAGATFELKTVLDSEVVARSEFQCRDKRCATLCRIEKTTVEVCGSRQMVHSGGACPKFEISTAARPKLPKEAPSAFDERQAALAPFLERVGGDRVVGVPLVGSTHGCFPWLVTFLRELGLGVLPLTSDSRSLPRGEARCYSFDACAPVKIAHGVLDAEVDTIFFPKIVTIGDRDGAGGRTCPMEQGLPEMAREALKARGRAVKVVAPPLSLDSDPTSWKLTRQLYDAARGLGAPRRRLLQAMRAAAEAQRRYDQQLADIGKRALAYAREHHVPAVVVCGALHVMHDPAIHAGIPRLLRENGVVALPMDCFPIPTWVHSLPRIAWADTKRALQTAIVAREWGDVFPLLLNSFGCGPGSFGEQMFGALLEGYPHTVLESDGHGGTAGYVTRVQAFLHAVRQYDGRQSPTPRRRLRLFEPLERRPIAHEKDSKMVVLSVTDRIPALIAAVYRSNGYDAVGAGPNNQATLALGRRDCSGKECLPYQLLWGGFRKHLEQAPPEKRTLLLTVSGEGMCRNCMFSIKDQLSVERMGLADQVALRHMAPEQSFGARIFAKMFLGLVAWDLLNQLTAYYRPLEREEGEVDALSERFMDDLERLLEEPSNQGRAAAERLQDLVGRASEAFWGVARRAPPGAGPRTVLLSGDVYVRLDEFAGDSLARRLGERGLRVIVEPLSTLSEYAGHERLSELFGLPTDFIQNAVMTKQMKRIRRQMALLVRKLHPWLPMVEPSTILDASRPVLDRYPQGEAPVTIGSVLHHWHEKLCDGVVVASPWGCGPALVAESLLRHQQQIPMLFVYCDGSPIDERKMNAFVFRLRRQPPRCGLSDEARRRPTA